MEETQSRSSVRCTFVCPPDIERCRLGRAAEIAVYRIVQEVLTNVLRHAGARRVTLVVRALDRDLVIEIEDDGCGMQVPLAPSSFGLLGMHERARAIGGVLAIDSIPGQGTAVSVRMAEVLV